MKQPVDLRYAAEQLWGAVRVLAIHPGPIGERLVGAYTAILSKLSDKSWPPELADDAQALFELPKVVSIQMPELGVWAGLRYLDEDEAMDRASSVLEFFYRVEKLGKP